MQFAVVSDSHGHTDNVAALAERLKAAGIRQAIHLGDDYDDAAALLDAGLEVLRVPGVFSDYYRDPNVPNRLVVTIGGLKILMTHADSPHKNDLETDEAPMDLARREQPDLVLFGHSHLPAIEDREGIIWLNPGHLKPEDKKGSPPTYAVVDTEGDAFSIKILNFETGETVLVR